jgi:hypothetical protein
MRLSQRFEANKYFVTCLKCNLDEFSRIAVPSFPYHQRVLFLKLSSLRAMCCVGLIDCSHAVAGAAPVFQDWGSKFSFLPLLP